MKPSCLLVTVQVACDADWLPGQDDFERWVVASFPGSACGEIGIRIVGEDESAALNAQYRHHTSATNVLAFPADVPPIELDSEVPLGDLVICAPVVEREAAQQRKSLEEHWAHMTVHGTLHLAGHDHQTREDAAAMERLERDVLARFGIADPYSVRTQ